MSRSLLELLLETQQDVLAAQEANRIKYALLRDEKTLGTAGGTFTNGAWRTRDLNTEVSDDDALVALSSNQITIQPGVYLFSATAPAYQVSGHQMRLQNIDAPSTVIIGSTAFASTSGSSPTHAFLEGQLSVSTETVLEVQHRCATTKATNGMGVPATIVGSMEVYAQVLFVRIGDA